jgi:glycyl-tRNA synthetase
MKTEKTSDNLMEKIVSLCKRRGFIFPGSEIYGGLANSFDYGPLGVELKNNIKNLWWKRFVQQRDDMVGIDAALIMNTKVWQASGHLENFTDPLVECKKCHHRFRKPDKSQGHFDWPATISPKASLGGDLKCPDCGGELTEAKQFNLMLKTFLGPVEDEESIVYFRPETAQAMFVDFKNVLDTTRRKLPFGIAQIGKAFRNEITPGNFIFRTREFEQMEIEYFIRSSDWEKYFEYWKNEMLSWMEEVGIDMSKVHELEVLKEDRAHYSSRTIDFEFDYPFGKKELFGLAYRTDFDLKNHKLEYIDEEEGIKMIPHVIEPTFGVDRAVLALLLSVYVEDEKDGEVRSYLKFKPNIAPIICAVSPLLKNKPELVEYANTKVYAPLKAEFGRVAWDDNGNIGKRYRRQDEIGTPYCVTVDFETLEDNSVTVRDRDTMKQERIKIGELEKYLEKSINS